MEAALRAIPGIADVQGVRDARIEVRGTPILFVAADVESLVRRANVPVVAGDSKTMYREAAQGRAVLASENFALLRGYKVGDIVDIPSPRGVLHLPIAGIVTDYSDQEGSLLMDRSVYRRNWNDDTLNIFRVYLAPGANEADVKRRILETRRRRSAAVRADQPRSAQLHPAAHQSVVRDHLRANRGGRSGCRAGDRQHA